MAECRSCGAEIFWARTSSDRLMPVDAKPVLGGGLELYRDGDQVRVRVITRTQERLAHRPHFMTCPDADGWRKR